MSRGWKVAATLNYLIILVLLAMLARDRAWGWLAGACLLTLGIIYDDVRVVLEALDLEAMDAELGDRCYPQDCDPDCPGPKPRRARVNSEIPPRRP